MSTCEATTLPAEFALLEPFTAQWAAPTTAERAKQRQQISEADRKTFFNTAKDHIERALTYLDTKKLGELDEQELCLMNLVLSFAHVALAEEIQCQDEPQQAQLRKHMTITLASADRKLIAEDQSQ